MSRPAPAAFRSGHAPARLRNAVALGVLAGALLGVLLVALIVIQTARPSTGPPPCAPDQPCGGPPPAPPTLATSKAWRSPELGFGLRYPSEFWRVEQEDARGLTLVLRSANLDLALTVRGVRSSDAQGLIDEHFADLRERLPELASDGAREHRLYGPNVGYQDGSGRAYRATTAAGTVSVLVMAATRGGTTAIVSAATNAPDVDSNGRRVKDGVLGYADSVLNTFRWPGE